MDIKDYYLKALATNRFSENDVFPIILGLYGETGSLMSAIKKLKREQNTYMYFNEIVKEELGDILWYFSMLCGYLDCNIEKVFSECYSKTDLSNVILTTNSIHPVAFSSSSKSIGNLDKALFGLAKAASKFFEEKECQKINQEDLSHFAFAYLECVRESKIPLLEIAQKNLDKTYDRFIRLENQKLPRFDKDFPVYERIPEEFSIKIIQLSNGKTRMSWNDVFIGDPLSDNISNSDGYRYHDVFHFGFAAILHWSPTFRALIKRKRKSKKEIDEAQDSGRAIVVEEGLSAWIFAQAKKLNFFKDQNQISYDILKVIRQFVDGYEVEKVPLALWEHAILESYKVFRELKKHEGGIIECSKENREIKFISHS